MEVHILYRFNGGEVQTEQTKAELSQRLLAVRFSIWWMQLNEHETRINFFNSGETSYLKVLVFSV